MHIHMCKYWLQTPREGPTKGTTGSHCKVTFNFTYSTTWCLLVLGLGRLSPAENECVRGIVVCSSWAAGGCTWGKCILQRHRRGERHWSLGLLGLAQGRNQQVTRGSDADALSSCGVLSYLCPSCQLCKMVSTSFVSHQTYSLGLLFV